MSIKKKCDVCDFTTSIEDGQEFTCPECTRRFQEELANIEAAVFEDESKIKLGDGKVYNIPPCNLKNARRLMQLLRTPQLNFDNVIFSFLPTYDDNGVQLVDEDNARIDGLYEILLMAFVKYPEIDRTFLEENVDVNIASRIIITLMGINGLKK